MKLCGKIFSFLIYDFDGVMTNNKALLFQNGDEAVFINRADGLAIEKIKSLNIEQMIMSSEKNPIVLERAKKLDIFAITGVNDKAKFIKNYTNNNIPLEETGFVGNDLNDFEIMILAEIKLRLVMHPRKY